jgi:hypothetical protein
VYWIAFALAGGSLILSAATLYVVLGVRRTTRRAERAGNERLEILREQRERLEFLHEERRMLDEELKWRRSIMDGEESLVALEGPRGRTATRYTSSQRRAPGWGALSGG